MNDALISLQLALDIASTESVTVGIERSADIEDDGASFPAKFAGLQAKLEQHFAESATLTATIRTRLAGVAADG